ncbi:hypothetical protein [Burkholderia ubonensis]|uniref:hypothetical protein n=1 Tax=Burkholderia ubonensis TaxID=101571 RepID=UPI0012FA8041|nr:hypothetical protein [Burkholderia ubonensis]
MYRNIIKIALILCTFSISGKASAWKLIAKNISNGYSSCSWRDNGNGTSEISIKFEYKSKDEIGGYLDGFSRAIIVYTYDKNGTPNGSNFWMVDKVFLNDEENPGVWPETTYILYYKPSYLLVGGIWQEEKAFVANVKVLIKNSVASEWPAIGVQAAIRTSSDDIGEANGAAYITRDGRNGSCDVVKEPETSAPPLPIQIKVSAPDWNLGELPQGNATKTFTNSAEQLCFTYTGTAAGGKLFVINAGSANGVSGNRYRLKHVEDPTQTVPYKVTLDSGTAKLSLPNGSNTALALNSSGKTCFAPTFETSVGGRVKDGDYVDTLTFTVVTKT